MKLIAAVLLLALASPARAQYPEAVVAAFCDADGRGLRLEAGPNGADVAALVSWEFEPAWDHLFLVSGYELNPVRMDAEEVEVEVRYTVVAEVSGEGVRNESRIDSVRLRLTRFGRTWRLFGPPPAPRLYASAFNADELFAQLMPSNSGYVSSSKLVWRLYQAAGWSLPYQNSADFLRGGYFRAVAEPAVGDVVAYLGDGVPYHVGLYEGEVRLASATVAGVLRTSLNAFAGEVRYLRLTRASQATPTPGDDFGSDEEEKDVTAPAESTPVPAEAEVDAEAEDTPAAAFEPPVVVEEPAIAPEPQPPSSDLEADIDRLVALEVELNDRLKRALRGAGRVVSESEEPARVDTPESASVEVLRQEIEEIRLRRQQLEAALASLRAAEPDAGLDPTPSSPLPEEAE